MHLMWYHVTGTLLRAPISVRFLQVYMSRCCIYGLYESSVQQKQAVTVSWLLEFHVAFAFQVAFLKTHLEQVRVPAGPAKVLT